MCAPHTFSRSLSFFSYFMKKTFFYLLLRNSSRMSTFVVDFFFSFKQFAVFSHFFKSSCWNYFQLKIIYQLHLPYLSFLFFSPSEYCISSLKILLFYNFLHREDVPSVSLRNRIEKMKQVSPQKMTDIDPWRKT